MSHRTRLALIGPFLAIDGCGFISAPNCTANFAPAVTVVVQDSASGSKIGSGAQLIVCDGTYADSMSNPANRPDLDVYSLSAAGERAGSYTVTVRKSGYREWIRSNVVVTKGVCHVTTVSLTALLQPL